MKLFFSVIAIMFFSVSFGQNQTTNTVLFAQCMFEIEDRNAMNDLSESIASNSYIEMVRLDHNTQRALIFTHNLDTLSDKEFRSWFGEYSQTVYCIQIGVKGVDSMNPYPFTNCQ